jgi:hypothetical protein
MVPSEDNRKVAEETIALFLYVLPGFLKPLGKRIVICLLEDNLRTSLMCVSSVLIIASSYTSAYSFYQIGNLPNRNCLLVLCTVSFTFVHLSSATFSFLVRHLASCFPTTQSLRPHVQQMKNVACILTCMLPSHHHAFKCIFDNSGLSASYMNYPWYCPKSTGISAVWERIQVMLGLAKKEDLPGPTFACKGFRLEDMASATATPLERVTSSWHFLFVGSFQV